MDAIIEIESYLINANIQEFTQNSMMRFACIKQLEIIGESCNHITNELRDNFPEVEWTQIVAMRNVFIHEYFGVDKNLVWEIIKTDLPNLKGKMERILDGL